MVELERRNRREGKRNVDHTLRQELVQKSKLIEKGQSNLVQIIDQKVMLNNDSGLPKQLIIDSFSFSFKLE